MNVNLTIGRLCIYINLPVCDLVFSESQIPLKTDNRRTNSSHGDTQDGDIDSFLRGSLQYQQHGNVVIVTVKMLSLHHRPLAPVTLYCLLWSPYGIGQTIIFLPCGYFFFSSPNLSRCRLDVCHTSTHGVALVRISDACLKPAARGSLKTQDAKKSPKIAIWAPSHNFVGLHLRN